MKKYDIIIQNLPKITKNTSYKINIKTSKTPPNQLINLGFNDSLFKLRKKFYDNPEDAKLFHKYKSIGNIYSLVNFNYFTSKFIEELTGYTIKNLSNNETILSRAYYKMWEILLDVPIPLNQKNIVSANIAEYPYGFVESIINYRKENTANHYYTISLKVEKPSLKVIEFMSKYRNNKKMVSITVGDGDINKLDNIREFTKLFNTRKADITTADGGFPTSDDIYEAEDISREIIMSHLIFNEVICAMSVQAENGWTVIKFFGIHTTIMEQIIYLMAIYYDEIMLVKPITSNILSNEIYVVGKGFRGIDNTKLEELYEITKYWMKIDPSGGTQKIDTYIESLFDFKIDKTFKEKIKKFNEELDGIRNDILKEIAIYIEKDKKGNINKDYFRKILEKQQDLAVLWLNKHHINIDENNLINFHKN